MATAGLRGMGEMRDPLVAFYVDLGRLAADEGEFKKASEAYHKALVLSRLEARRHKSPWAAFAEPVRTRA